MFKRYFKIGWRNQMKHKGLFAINIGGLALGIATCLVISLFVVDELSYDRYNEHADRIVRVVLKGRVNGETIKEAITPAPVAPTLKAEFPEVEEGTRIRRVGRPKIAYENTTFRTSEVAFVDPNFFRVFSLHFIQGDPMIALKNPGSIVITESDAKKYFGNEDPLNKVLDFKDAKEQYKITGVIEDVPTNSHFHFDLFASMEGMEDAKNTNWMASNYFNYLLLRDGASYKTLESKLPAIVTKYMGPQVEQMGMTYEKFKQNGNEVGLFFQPITDIHLHSEFTSQTEMEAGGNIKDVFIFAAVAIFMLLIACVNFMNLSTAAASRRNKEIGVRKVLGSQRRQLVQQFIAESFITTAVAMIVAVLLVDLSAPVFNRLAGKQLDPMFLFNPQVLIVLGIFTLVVTLLAGSYPAFLLSSLRPITALKNGITGTARSKTIRSALVVFQFVISAALILSIIIVDQQLDYIQHKALGYERDQLLVLRDSYLLGNNENAFKNQLAADPRVAGLSMSAYLPAGSTHNSMTGVYPGQQKEAIRRTILFNVDDQYITTMGMRLTTGRNFSGIPANDSLNVIINETAVKAFELGDQAVGRQLTGNVGPEGAARTLTVIGVVKDFHFRSLHEPIAPLIMLNNPFGGLIIRAKSEDMPNLLSTIETKWKSFGAGEPLSFGLLNELYAETYVAEQKTGNIMRIFGALTILVACLGLFGLVTFTAEQRVKEIGIRKVLGADVTEIVALLSRDLLVLVVISFFIAFPLGYYVMNIWLEDFVYRVDIEWWVFGLTGVSTLFVAFCTMTLKTVKAGLANPIKSLRME
ncbi:MAG TPA: ABC transporter permease [Chryseolinea sp.]|nr:ABC transporter permease [Chryseolinea sp.]